MGLHFGAVFKRADLLLQGGANTLLLSFFSLLIAFVLGVVVAAFRESKTGALRVFGTCWVEFLRNTPFLVLIFFLYYGLPELGISTDPLVTASLGLGISASAGVCETVRSGFLAVKAGYYEAAAALGHGRLQILAYVIIPIALRLSFKPLGSQFINLVLSTSVAFSITVQELMGVSKSLNAELFLPFEVFLTVMALYCLITFSLSFVLKAIDRKIGIQL